MADSQGYGWAIAKQLASAGAKVALGTWPPVLGLFKKSFESGRFDEDRQLPDGTLMEFAGVYPLDAAFDKPEDVPQDVRFPTSRPPTPLSFSYVYPYTWKISPYRSIHVYVDQL